MELQRCTLCPRRCGANRSKTVGTCGGGSEMRIARAALHFGEEPCITGARGSGTVFFSGCVLRCRFCQNYHISQENFGEIVSESRLAEIFLELQEKGAENINLVTPSHFAPMIVTALSSVKNRLSIPVVCNCSGYESKEILNCFNGLVDVYLPDLKYYSPDRSLRYSGAKDYFTVASVALKEMFRQTGACSFSEDGILQKGLLIRHLVLPGGTKDSIEIFRWISENFPNNDIRISVMRQYTPCGDLTDCPELNRKLFSAEYDLVLREVSRLGLLGYVQGRDCDNLTMTPDFNLTGVIPERSI